MEKYRTKDEKITLTKTAGKADRRLKHNTNTQQKLLFKDAIGPLAFNTQITLGINMSKS